MRLERQFGNWLLSALLDLVAGYGERPARYGVSSSPDAMAYPGAATE